MSGSTNHRRFFHILQHLSYQSTVETTPAADQESKDTAVADFHLLQDTTLAPRCTLLLSHIAQVPPKWAQQIEFVDGEALRFREKAEVYPGGKIFILV